MSGVKNSSVADTLRQSRRSHVGSARVDHRGWTADTSVRSYRNTREIHPSASGWNSPLCFNKGRSTRKETSAECKNKEMQRMTQPEQRWICGGQGRYIMPSPLRNLQQRRRYENERIRRKQNRLDQMSEWAEGNIAGQGRRDGIHDGTRGSGCKRVLRRVPIVSQPPLYPTGRAQVGRERNSEHAPSRRGLSPAEGCERNRGSNKHHQSEKIKRRRDPSLSPRRIKSETWPAKRRAEPETPTMEEQSDFDADAGEVHNGTRKGVRWAVPHAKSWQSTSAHGGRFRARGTAARSWRSESSLTKEDSSSESDSSEGESEIGEIRKDQGEARKSECSPFYVSVSDEDEEEKSQGAVENEAASLEETEDEAEDARGKPLCLGARNEAFRDVVVYEPGTRGIEHQPEGKAGHLRHPEPPAASPTSPLEALEVTEKSCDTESARSLRPEEIEVQSSGEVIEVASKTEDELRAAIHSIGGETISSSYFTTAVGDAEYVEKMLRLEEEHDAVLSQSSQTKAYDDINLVTYPDDILTHPPESLKGFQVPPPLASSSAEPFQFPSSELPQGFVNMEGLCLPPPGMPNGALGVLNAIKTIDAIDAVDDVGDGILSSQPDVEPQKHELGAVLHSESAGVQREQACLIVESNQQKSRMRQDGELVRGSPKDSVRPCQWDGIPSVPLSTLEGFVTCQSCSRVFNRAPVCRGYLLQLNRPMQCLCGCVLCTLCFRAQGGCRKHWVISEHGTVNATANALADMPGMEAVGVWDLEREGRDRFMTGIETEECVERMLAEGSPSKEELKRAFQTLIKNPANDMSFAYWENKLLPEYDAYRYVCMPHIPGFWDRVLVGKWCPESTQAAIRPDVHLPRLFDVDMGVHYFHWCCFVLKEQIILAAWCTTKVYQGGSMRVLPLIDSSLRGTVSEVEFKRMIFLLRTWFTVQYHSREGGEGLEREIHTVLDCQPLEGPTIVQTIAELALRSGMEKADPSYVHKRVRPFALDADVFSAKNAAAAALFDYRPLSCCESQTLYMNVAEEFSNCHRNSETGNTVTRPICYEGDRNVYI
ncbi:uncharacterized protein LOC144996400 [Oryzias latipes]